MIAIHQWYPHALADDERGRYLRWLRLALRQGGLESEIRAAGGDDVLALGGEEAEAAVWLYHVCPMRPALAERPPTPHLAVIHEAEAGIDVDWRAVAAACANAAGVVAASEAVAAGLCQAGVDARVLPLHGAPPLLAEPAGDRPTRVALRERLNVLALGPLSEAQRQHEVLEAFLALEHFLNQPARLILAGPADDAAYVERLRRRVAEAGAGDRVWLRVDPAPAVMAACRAVAELAVGLGDDPRMRMALVEAWRADVPVLGRAAGAAAGWLKDAALALDAAVEAPRDIAAAWHLALSEPGVRQRLLAAQRRSVRPWSTAGLRASWLRVLHEAGFGGLPPANGDAGASYWQVEGPIGSIYSLAIVNRELGMALADSGRDVGLHRLGENDDVDSEWEWLAEHVPAARALAERGRQLALDGVLPEVSLRFHYPPWVDGMTGQVRVVHSYGWEETAFPEPYVAAFNRRLDGITTLSREVSKALRDSGISLPLVAVGTGVDHVLREAPVPVPLSAATQAAGFRFLHVSSCFPRKGPDVLLEAWGRAFRADDDVVLVIKTFPNPHNDVARQLAEWQARDPGYPAVEIVDRDVPQAQLNWLYRFCDALVAPSRGEGFGMPMAEAMLFELPVIVTGWGGQTDFCTPDTAWLCRYDFTYSGSHLEVPHSAWVEPDPAHLAQLMREVRRASPEDKARRTRPARERVLRDYSWAAVAERTARAVARFAQPPMLRKEPRIGWISTWNVRCGIANYSDSLLRAVPPDRLALLALPGGDLEARDQSWVVRCNTEALARDPARTLLAEIDRHGCEVAVLQYNFGFFSLDAMAALLRGLASRGVAAYIFLHSTDDKGRVSLSSIVPDLALAERIVVHSVVDVNRFKDWGLVDNVLLFPHGVGDTPPPPALEERARRGLESKRVIASYGFLLPHKGMQALIEAFARLAVRQPDLHLLLVCALYPNDSSRREKADCEALIGALGLQGRVTMINDFLPDAESLAWLQMADVIVFPYQYTQESSSAAVRGGLAAGRPVLATPLDIFDDVAGGVEFLSGTDAETMAVDLEAWLRDGEALEGLRLKGVRWCDARRWSRVSTRLLNLIDGVANDLPAEV
ncbi:MAG: glycosyltransferase [Pigmentiphaga sp.]|nr:glycosyltransferase [Pigmentiphaga sp.]